MDGVDLLIMDVQRCLGWILLAGVKAEQVAFIVSYQPSKQSYTAEAYSQPSLGLQ